MHCGAADGVQYLRDLCMTLCYFLQAYPSGAQLLLQGQAGIVTQLTSLYDDLIPQAHKAISAAVPHNKPQAVQVSSLPQPTPRTPTPAQPHALMQQSWTWANAISCWVLSALFCMHS